MENLNIIIGNNIKELRKINKLTQFELAEKLNYSNKAISRWESGEVVPDVATLDKICEIFNIPISQIFEANVTTKKVKRNYKFQMGNKLAISLLGVLVVWLIAVIIYVGFKATVDIDCWQVFIWAIPLSCVVGVIFNSVWGNLMFNYLIISVLNWTLIACIYVSIAEFQLWFIFLVPIPIQVGIILWSNITRNNLKSKNNIND